MKRLLMAAVVASAVLAAGCEKEESQPASGPQSTLGKVAESARKTAAGVSAKSAEAAKEAERITGEASGKSGQGVTEAVDAARDAAFQAAQKGVDALGQQIQDLQRRVAAAPEPIRAHAEATLKDLNDRHVVLQKRLEELRSASAERWRQISDEITQLTEKARTIAGDLARQLG